MTHAQRQLVRRWLVFVNAHAKDPESKDVLSRRPPDSIANAICAVGEVHNATGRAILRIYHYWDARCRYCHEMRRGHLSGRKCLFMETRFLPISNPILGYTE